MNDKLIMAEAPYSDEDSSPSVPYFNQNDESGTCKFKSILNEFLPTSSNPVQDDDYQKIASPNEIEDQISESLDQLSTKHNNDEDDGQFRKRARVGYHYQAKIPKYSANLNALYESGADELLWNPLPADSNLVENYLKRIASITKMLIPMGNHLRDDEDALYTLQKHNHNYESAFEIISNAAKQQQSPPPESFNKMPVWSEEECRNFEQGILNFGKNFFLIRKYKVATRSVSELVQFYYLWKKTERYDLFAPRMRSGKKKYTLNPGISDLMCRYLGGQAANNSSNNVGAFASVNSDVQFLVEEGAQNTNNAVLN